MQSFGRYQLVELIASGGMAEVWRATLDGPAGVRKEVALKLLRGEHAARGDFARMLVEEARLAARLAHANVVQVLELCEEGGRYAIAMELVRGRDLGRVVERCRELGLRVGLPRILHLGVEVAKALAYAHRLAEEGRPVGLVHRDVSPSNVLVSFEGEVKLADFGIARVAGLAGLTDPGTVKGKLAYMAPEQARGDALDGRADVFALGVVLWELCAGRRLFARDGDAATLAAVLAAEPVSPPSVWNEDLPPEVDAALLGALERDPARRTASAEALQASLAGALLRLVRHPSDQDLRPLMARLWSEEERRGAAAAAEATAVRSAPQREPSATRTVAGPGRRRAWLATALVVMMVVALGVGGLAWMRREAEAAPVAPPVPARSEPAGAPLDAEALAAGVGLLEVHATPWANVLVDDLPVGETPRQLRLTPGAHRVRAVHPTLGADRLEVALEPGRRQVWRAELHR